MSQISLPDQPVADHEWARGRLADLDEERVLEGVRTLTDEDGMSAPTTRGIAEALFCEPEEAAAIGGPEFARAARALQSLRGRGVILSHRDRPGYFGRHDELVVVRWTSDTGELRRTPAVRAERAVLGGRRILFDRLYQVDQ